MHRRDNGLNQYQDWTQSAINYENNGNLYQDGWMTASYNALNQPISIWSWRTNPTGSSIAFSYDPLGRCVKRQPGGGVAPLFLYYDGWSLIQEGPASGGWIWNGTTFVTTAGSGGAARVYLNGARVDEIVMSSVFPSASLIYHHYDGSGNCLMLTNDSAQITEQYQYDAFGKPYFYDAAGNNLGSSPYGNRFLFTGREYLTELKLYDYRNRMYQPELGHFLQPDPKEFEAGDYNLYRYCHNDPVNKSDPTGLLELSRGEAMLRYCDGQLSSDQFKQGIDRGNKAKISNALSKGDISLAQVTAFAASSQGQKVLDPKTFDRFTAEGYRIRDTLLRAAANNREHPGYWEYSAEAIQNDRDANQVRALQPTPGVEGVDGYPYGNKIHREQVPDGWHLIGHIYTQAHPIPYDLIERDRRIFQDEQIAAMAVFRDGRGWVSYNPPIRE
jgi:RHS repeat-associated protein